MLLPTALARFNDDDLAQVPALLDGVIAGLITRFARPTHELPPDERPFAAPFAHALSQRRQRLVSDYHASLRHHLLDAGRRHVAQHPLRHAAAPNANLSPRLSLVDDDTVAADVEVARLVDVVRSVADHELRELAAFLAALAGDAQVGDNRLVLGPDRHARALWEAARQLPAAQDLPALFLRHAARPLADALRRHWAAACTRLEDAGIEPAAYRTVILHAGVNPQAEAPAPPSGHTLRGIARALDAIEARLVVPSGVARPTERSTPIGRHAPSDPDPTLTDTPTADPGHATATAVAVQRIFDTLQADHSVDPDFRPAIGRLRELALRAAAIDRTLADRADHPLWSLVDRIAWQGHSLPPPPQRERVRTMQVINGLVDQLAKEERPLGARFQWALERVIGLEHNRLERRIRQQEAQIAALAAVEQQLIPGSAGDPTPPASDLAQMPTVPADLYDAAEAGFDPTEAAAAWLDHLDCGDLAQVQIDGRWTLAQLLWRSVRGELFLWAGCLDDAVWPLRRDALRRMSRNGLARPATPHTAVREIVRGLVGRRAIAVTG